MGGQLPLQELLWILFDLKLHSCSRNTGFPHLPARRLTFPVVVLEDYRKQNNENIFETSTEHYSDESFAVVTKAYRYIEGESKGVTAEGK